MNKKRISVTTLIIIFIVAILIGGGLGYYLTQQSATKRALAMKNGENLREQSITARDSKGENATSSSITALPNKGENYVGGTTASNNVMGYEQSESIAIDGKEVYGIGTKTNKEADGVTRTGVYINNTKLKSFREGSSILDVKVLKGDEKYILILVDGLPEFDGGDCVLVANLREELVGAFNVAEVNTTYKYGDLNNYDIKEDKVVFIKSLRDVKVKEETKWLYGIYEVSVNDNFLNYKLVRICNADELQILSSK